MSDVDIVHHLKDHYDQEEYGLRVITFRRMRNTWGWRRSRQQRHTLESIEQFVREFRHDFPTEVPRPSDETCDNTEQFDFHVPRELISKLLKITEPTAVQVRLRGRLRRRRFWCAGVNDGVASVSFRVYLL
ncbi:hypothetical protein K503DRAFT_138026 [Rhizopogon vinicolor AM-OR11-026]|uniref:Uncharacterized protein n=1 Tax=Rhizopogon vinicolor AM-OR11-026 TaxID=1314800 RepID=A0A1B7N1N5_9AGAM|nr:hypothetical protein K503DRAFT_138026 [Rhizopogon vinicolor AM-OR11-026]